MKWTSSGITNTFEFELVDVFDPTTHVGWYTQATGGKINVDVDSENWGSLSLDIDGDPPPDWAALRVWHTAELDGDTVRHALGTFLIDRPDLTYALARQTGSVDMYAEMSRMAGDLRRGDATIPKNAVVRDRINTIVENAGGVLLRHPGVPATKLSSAHVWESGTSVRDELLRLAKSINCDLGCDELGRITLRPHVSPSRASIEWRLTPSNVVDGIGISAPDIINRVVATYERDKKRYFASAEVGVSHPWHFNRIGRWCTEELQVGEIPDNANIQGVLNSRVKSELEEVSTYTKTYDVTAPYQPITPGTVGMLELDGEQKRCRASQIEITLDSTMEMELTLEEVS